MIQRTIFILAALAVIVPTAIFAQASGMCSITRTLARGATGSDVTTLQNFLATQGTFGVAATGYFGPITEAALANWQLQVGIVTNLPDGGVYGPKTRAYVAQTYCGGSHTPPVSQCPTPPAQPAYSCSGSWQKIYGTNACHAGWTCAAVQTGADKPPVIYSITGPFAVKAGQSADWNITASDPEGGALTYSVVWGDEGAALSQLLILAGGNVFSAQTSVSHAYAAPGSYTIVVFAKDSANNVGKATHSITVAAAPVQSGAATTTASNSGTGGILGCSYGGSSYPEGTATEGVSASNLCLPATICENRTAYIPTFRCLNGAWVPETQSPGASCLSGGTMYANGSIKSCTINPSAGGCPLGPTFKSWTCTNGQWMTGEQSSSGQCLYGGRAYAEGETCVHEGCPGEVGWNTGKITVCKGGAWKYIQCGWPNITGPGRFPYCPS